MSSPWKHYLLTVSVADVEADHYCGRIRVLKTCLLDQDTLVESEPLNRFLTLDI